PAPHLRCRRDDHVRDRPDDPKEQQHRGDGRHDHSRSASPRLVGLCDPAPFPRVLSHVPRGPSNTWSIAGTIALADGRGSAGNVAAFRWTGPRGLVWRLWWSESEFWSPEPTPASDWRARWSVPAAGSAR